MNSIHFFFILINIQLSTKNVNSNDCASPDLEEYSYCGNRCNEACEPDPNCTFTCDLGCFCRFNYKRVNGTCVDSQICETSTNLTPYPPYTTTPSTTSTSPSTNPCANPDQIWRKGNTCEDNCATKRKICKGKYTWGCYCQKGLKYNSRSKICVEPKYCPKMNRK